MRILRVLAILTLAISLLTSKASAGSVQVQIIQGQNFGPGPFAFIGVTPFDPALGTLDSVNVTLQGQITADLVTNPFFCNPPFADLCPTPYSVSLDQTFFGLIGRYFSFGSPAQFSFSGEGTGDVPLVSDFSYEFTFTPFSDLVGFVVPNSSGPSMPPIQINGKLSNFLPTLLDINEVDGVLSSGGGFGGTLEGLSAEGALIVEYNYTPNPVPEPGTFILLNTAFTGIALARRFGRARLARCAAHPRRNTISS